MWSRPLKRPPITAARISSSPIHRWFCAWFRPRRNDLKIRKALTRTPTLVVSLRVTPETDVAAVADYWGGPKFAEEILPFLEANADSGAAHLVGLGRLLPPIPRQLLYTFPDATFGHTGYYPDCHWTSLNFANREALDRLADPTLATALRLAELHEGAGALSLWRRDLSHGCGPPAMPSIRACIWPTTSFSPRTAGRRRSHGW